MRVELYRKSGSLTRVDIAPFVVLYVVLHRHAWASTDVFSVFFAIPLALCLHVLTFLSQRWSVRCQCAVSYTRCADIKTTEFALVTDDETSQRDLVPVHRESCRGGEAWISFQRRVYLLIKGSWVALDYPSALAVEHYTSARGLATKEALNTARSKWGANVFEIPEPTFLELFEEHYVAPFFVFQVLCCVLWSLDEYWVYSFFTLVMLLVFEATVCLQRQRSLEMLREMRKPARGVFVYRGGGWRQTMSDDLVPGDLLSVAVGSGRRYAEEEESVVPCDCVLIGGSCVINEAMLTGESVPQRKESMVMTKEDLQIEGGQHKRHVILGGTEILEASFAPCLPNSGELDDDVPAPPDGGCVGVVLRTGFETSQGKLMRTILFATERVVGSSETGVFIATLLVFALLAAAYVLHEGLKDERRNRFKLFLHCVLIVTSVVPPELPMELSLAVTNSLAALSRAGVFCTEPFRIALAGGIDVCCFDKTGTLTSEDLEVKGLSTVEEHEPRPLFDDMDPLPCGAERVLAACHSLSLVHHALVGDTLERAQVEALGWTLVSCNNNNNETIVAPKRTHRRRTQQKDPAAVQVGALRIIHRFGFSSELRRMSAVVLPVSGSARPEFAWVVAKGAPEAIKPLLAKVPEGYDEAYTAHSRRGLRVLALASKRILMGKQPTRAQAESGLTLDGFLVLASALKPSTATVIQELQASSHKCLIITGDEVLTALHVSRELRIAQFKKAAVLTADDGKLSWRFIAEDHDEGTREFNLAEVAELGLTHDIVVRGDALELLEEHGLDAVCGLGICFARVKPDQKELIVATLNKAGLTTLMCGDGTNDVGALKRAHVGVSLAAEQPSDSLYNTTEDDQEFDPRLVKLGDASIASPFASKTSTIQCVVSIVRQGRCTLVMMLQVFKILALMCLVSAYMLSSLYLAGVKQGDTQMIAIGLSTAALFFLASRAEPLQELSARRPPRRVFELRPTLSIVLQFAVHLTALVKVVQLAAPYQNRDDPNHVPDGPFKPSVVNTAVFLLSAFVQINTFATNYCGHPFMQSLYDHTLLHRTLVLAYGVLVLAATGAIPALSSALQLLPAPTPDFKRKLIGLLVADTAAVWGLSIVI